MQLAIHSDSLGDLDEGAARAIIDAAIREAVADLDDRGDDGKPRAVEIKLTLAKMDNGLVEAHVEAAARVPRRRTNSTVGKLKRDGDKSRLMFQAFAPEDPDQRTIDEALAKKERE